MVFEVIIGRSKKDVEKYGKEGTIFLGKQYVTMGQVTSLSNPVYLDVAGSHVVFVVGKRGSGKSYTMGAIAEGLADLPREIRQNLSIILLDTMGIYWTMKYPNRQDEELLQGWNMEAKALDVTIYTPSGFYKHYKQQGIPVDFPFSIRPIDVSPEDWCLTFAINQNSREGVLITKVVQNLNQGNSYDLTDLLAAIRSEKEAEVVTKNIVLNQFEKVKGWGIFSALGTPLKDLVQGGQITVLDVSPYATMAGGWSIKALVVSLIAKNLFNQRLLARKAEEFKTVDTAMHYFSKDTEQKLEEPLVWLALDEAHELLPNEGKTTATDALVTILREGRQPGISLILASQQPGKIHTDVMTQADVVIAHRLTAKLDVDALGQLMQSYMRHGLDKELNTLPAVKGAAIVFDDSNERLFPIQMRPRVTWHGGSSPFALQGEKKAFERKLQLL